MDFPSEGRTVEAEKAVLNNFFSRQKNQDTAVDSVVEDAPDRVFDFRQKRVARGVRYGAGRDCRRIVNEGDGKGDRIDRDDGASVEVGRKGFGVHRRRRNDDFEIFAFGQNAF